MDLNPKDLMTLFLLLKKASPRWLVHQRPFFCFIRYYRSGDMWWDLKLIWETFWDKVLSRAFELQVGMEQST